MTGDKVAGLEQLKRAAEGGHLLRPYAKILLALAAMRERDTALVRATITEVQHIYRDNFFPDMKADWRAYPDNIGHTIFNGCFRCHDGSHRSADGRVISNACTSCHVIMSQGRRGESRLISPDGLEFEHPVDIGDLWKQAPCTTCHTGALP